MKRLKRIIVAILTFTLVIMLSACGGASPIPEAEAPEDIEQKDNIKPGAGEEETDGENRGQLQELRLNRGILENIGKPMAGILRDEPDLEPQSFGGIDAATMCFTDPSKSYSYILFTTQYLPYDEYAEGAIEEKDIRCEGIYTTAGEMFPDLIEGEKPDTFFDKAGVEIIYSDELRSYGIAYYIWFKYEQMNFSVWGGTEDSPAVMSAGDIATAQITTENENLINEYYNDKVYPDGIGCAAAIDRAKAYRSSRGGSDCSFYVMRDGIVDARDNMELSDSKVYIVYPDLDWETRAAEDGPVYYVGYKTGEVFEWLTSSG